jgi:hypothetical protein
MATASEMTTTNDIDILEFEAPIELHVDDLIKYKSDEGDDPNN